MRQLIIGLVLLVVVPVGAMDMSPEQARMYMSQAVVDGAQRESDLLRAGFYDQAACVGIQTKSFKRLLDGVQAPYDIQTALELVDAGLGHIARIRTQVVPHEIRCALVRFASLLCMIPSDADDSQVSLEQSLKKADLELQIRFLLDEVCTQEQELLRAQEYAARAVRMMPYWCPSPTPISPAGGFFVWGPMPACLPCVSVPMPMRERCVARSLSAPVAPPAPNVGVIGSGAFKKKPHPAAIQTQLLSPDASIQSVHSSFSPYCLNVERMSGCNRAPESCSSAASDNSSTLSQLVGVSVCAQLFSK